jgi:hypothetical protein
VQITLVDFKASYDSILSGWEEPPPPPPPPPLLRTYYLVANAFSGSTLDNRNKSPVIVSPVFLTY